MYQVSRVQTALSGLVGWRQPSNGCSLTVSATNIASSSGLYFPDFSPLLESQNIYYLQDNENITEAQFNTVLTNLVKSAAIKVANNVFLQDDVCENNWLFSYENVWTDVLTNDASFVGYEITPPKGKYLIRINSIQTTFDTVDTVKILLFHSSKLAPLQTKTINLVANDTTETVLDWTLPYDYGKYYIGYLRGSMTAKAVNREYDEASIMNVFKTLKIENIIVSHTAETLFDIDDVEESDDTYGINLNISTWKDYTTIIEQNKYRFVNALGLQTALDVADMILKSTRSNFTERNMRAVAMMEKEGLISNDPNVPKVNSLVNRLKSELRELKRTFTLNDPIKMGTL